MSIHAEDAMLAEVARALDDPAPCGPDLRADMGLNSLYQLIRDARSAARMQERAFDDDPQRAPGTPDEWQVVENRTIEALTLRSKDIELASWLIEALTRRDGLAGFTRGVRVMTVLIDTFWHEGLYPALEAGDPEARTFAVSGLSGQDRDGSLIQPLRKIVLFEMPDGVPVSFWEYERACALAAAMAQGEHMRRVEDTLPGLDDMEVAARADAGAMAGRARAAEDACAAWRALHEAFARLCRESEAPVELPSSSRVAALLEDIRAASRRYSPEIAEEAVVMVEDSVASGEGEDGGVVPVSAVSPDAPQTRAEMLDAVMAIATRFRVMEPHSPFSYTLENAVRRARLSLHELLAEVVSEEASRSEILIRLGIQERDF